MHLDRGRVERERLDLEPRVLIGEHLGYNHAVQSHPDRCRLMGHIGFLEMA